MSDKYIRNHGISIVIDHIEENNNDDLNEAFNMNNNFKSKNKNNGKQIESTKIKVYQDMPAVPPPSSTTTILTTKSIKNQDDPTVTVTKSRTPNSPRFASKILSKLQQIRSKTTKIGGKTPSTTTKTCININGNNAPNDDTNNDDGIIIKHNHHVVNDKDDHNDDDVVVEQTKDETGYNNVENSPQKSSIMNEDTQSTTTIGTTSTITETLTPFNSTMTLKESDSSQTTSTTTTTSTAKASNTSVNSIIFTTPSTASLLSERGKLEDVGKLPMKLHQTLHVKDDGNGSNLSNSNINNNNNSQSADNVSVTENANGTGNQNEIMTKHVDRQTTIIKCNIDDDNDEQHKQQQQEKEKEQQQQQQHVDEESRKVENVENDNEVVAVAKRNDESQITTETTTNCNSISINRFVNVDNNNSNSELGMGMGAVVGIRVNGNNSDNNNDDGQQSGICDGICKLDWTQQQQQPEEPEHQQQQQQQQKNDTRQLGNVCATPSLDSRPTKADCASALTETVSENINAFNTNSKSNLNLNPNSSLNSNLNSNSNDNSHVVTIQINQPINNIVENKSSIDLANTPRSGEKQVTVVKVNEQSDENLSKLPQVLSAERIDLHLNFDKMVQKPINDDASTNSMAVGNINSAGTTVTELNVNNSTYLYYMMSSGQFSPCDTLDSGTGSDLESSNGQSANGSVSPKISNKSIKNNNNNNSNIITTTTNAKTSSSKTSITGPLTTISSTKNIDNGVNTPPKLEMHLKTTKIRLNNGQNLIDKQHQRAGSLTDSEESEVSSLSCDSLHSTEFIRQSSLSPTNKSDKSSSSSSSTTKMLKPFLPDSLLRDIRDRKFPTNDFETKYGTKSNCNSNGKNYTINDAVEDDHEEDGDTFVQHRNGNSKQMIGRSNGNANKRASMPILNKTYEMEDENGQFIDTKMSSIPRKYEADKYYNFHVKEHENFRTFGNNHNKKSVDSNGYDDMASDLDSVVHEDDFVGYKDIRFGSDTSTIRSSKGTVRGVKNRVRNGIATFLQMQEPQLKNYKVKEAGKVVLYTTSMGIIRDTYAKCANVKQILRTLLVKFEERDVFMSLEYQQEIRERMHLDMIKVPQLFVEGQHIGNAETVERLNESGELRQLLKPYKCIATAHTCQTCGGYRLLPCPSCKGSKKSVHRNHFTTEFVALKCMNCDEVGLVKCHNC